MKKIILIDGCRNEVVELAREFAEIFYDQATKDEYMGAERSTRFRQTYPTRKDYIRGLKHKPNGEIIIDKPGWRYHEKQAYTKLCEMLNVKSISKTIKDAIHSDIIAYHNAAIDKSNTIKVTQRHSLH